MAQNPPGLQAAIAATRFGLGARPGEIEAATADPKAWLIRQIRPQGADQPAGSFANARDQLIALAGYREDRKEAKAEGVALPKAARRMAAQPASMAIADTAVPAAPAMDADAQRKADMLKTELKSVRNQAGEEFLARAQLAASTPDSFRERWATFWFNHFTVSAVKLESAVVTGPFEREAIRPRVFGRFEELLVASSTHPAMLLYLDQARSAGPNSIGGRTRKLGLNENLAREIMELHTVGADAGYTQADVTEFARALTGWSVGGPKDAGRGFDGRYLFRAAIHEPGGREIMGRQYDQSGEAQARAVLHALAIDPRTAKHISRKLAIHFVADDPPPALVDRLSDAWMKSDGRLDVVARALIEAPEAWDPQARKFKTPYEFVVSGYRAAGVQPTKVEHLRILTALGQKPFSPPSPKGWSDEAADWATSDGVIKRLEWAKGFAVVVGPLVDPVATARSSLGARLSERTATAVARAESRPEALALLLMSPEFQRR
ncbi:MAG TPA: DUF1800 family protein [Caulobacteraceae bacterium]|jgi:uncharacterized protein (DUF1800 family)|nr:DUF1800 family protein [Caulobacteraceae bacterium]